MPNNCFRFSFFPTKSLATSTRVRASVLSLWTYNIMRWFSLESPVVERKWTIWYVNKNLTWGAELPLCRFLFASYCCRWLQIIFISGLFFDLDCFFDYTSSASLVHGFTHNKSVPCLFSTCLDFFFGGSCEDIVRLPI